MSTSFELGTYYKYMVADKTEYPWAVRPIQGTGMPLYLGLGPEVPTGSFTCGVSEYQVELVVDEDDVLNPFPCPLVMAVRL